jgi:hypothetical protein
MPVLKINKNYNQEYIPIPPITEARTFFVIMKLIAKSSWSRTQSINPIPYSDARKHNFSLANYKNYIIFAINAKSSVPLEMAPHLG